MKASQQKWSSKAYKLRTFLERFALPQTVKVVEGILDVDNEHESCCNDEIITLHREETLLQVSVTNAKKEQKTLPLTIPTKVLRLSPEFAHSRLNSRSILEQLSKVLFLIVIDEDNETSLKRNEKFRINYNSVKNHGESFSFVLEAIDDSSKIVTITESCKAHFKPILDPKEYSISKVVRQFGLPQFVLVQTSDCETLINEDDRVVALESTFTEFIVIASNTIEPDCFFPLKKNSELIICTTLETELLQNNTTESSCSNTDNMQRDTKTLLYEDMSCTDLSFTTECDAQGSCGKDNTESHCVNRYVPTPSAKAIKTFFGHLMVFDDAHSQRRSVYSFPKIILQEQLIDHRKTHETSHDVPRNDTNIHCSQGATSQDAVTIEHAQKPPLDHMDNNANEPIYQEISIRETPEEYSVKHRKDFAQNCGRRKSEGQARNSNRKSVSLKPRKWTSFRQFKNTERKADIQIEPDSSNANVRSQTILQGGKDGSKLCHGVANSDKRTNDQKRTHDINCLIHQTDNPNQKSTNEQRILSSHKRIPDQDRTIDQSENGKINSEGTLYRRKDRTDVHFGRESVVYTLRSKHSTSNNDCVQSIPSHIQQITSLQQRSHSVGCLKESLPEGLTSKSSTQNRQLALKPRKMDERPPLPPPRTSSIKPAEKTSSRSHGEELHSELSKQRHLDRQNAETLRQALDQQLLTQISMQDKISSVYRETVDQVRQQFNSTSYSKHNPARIPKSETFVNVQHQHSLSGVTNSHFSNSSPRGDKLKEQKHRISNDDSLYEEITKPFLNGNSSSLKDGSKGGSASGLEIPKDAPVETGGKDGKLGNKKPSIEETKQRMTARQGHLTRSKTEIGFEAKVNGLK